jgi:NAD(P)-dependent dehydrogenase (short-subunit alcohol dehydrogenase family)
MDDLFSVKNKVILITGASSGIGRATAILANQQGAVVILTGRNQEQLEITKNLLRFPERSSIIKADLISATDISELVSKVDLLDGVILSSGVMQTLMFKFVTLDSLSNMMRVNFESPILLLSSLLKSKKINNNSSIVCISSIAGNLIGSPGNAMYSASKAALHAVVKVLALEMAPKKIRVNSIAPGMVKTEMWGKENTVLSKDQLDADEKRYPLGYGNPEDIAKPVLFLLSDASKWITGSLLVVDGGFTIQ